MKKILLLFMLLFLLTGCAKEYNISIIENELGTITVSQIQAKEKEEIFVMVNPKEGYQLEENSLMYNDTIFTDSFMMPNIDVVIQANYIKKTYKIITDIENAQVILNKENASKEDVIKVEIKPYTGYTLDTESIRYVFNDKEFIIENNTFLMPEGDITLKADVNVKQIYDYDSYLDVSYGNSPYQEFDIYIPKVEYDEYGLFVFIHGGFWATGDKSSFVDYSEYLASETGIVVANINYRLANGKGITFEDILDDIDKCMNKIDEFTKEKGIKITKVAFGGHSAGGHLSLLYAYNNNCVFDVAFCLSAAGPADLEDKNYEKLFDSEEVKKIMFELLDVSSIEEGYSVAHKYSPVKYVNEKTPPTIMAYGVLDILVPLSNAQTLEQTLKNNNVTYDYIEFKLSGHLLSTSNSEAMMVRDKLLNYIDLYLK